MAGLIVLTPADLARNAGAVGGPLAPPVAPRRPMDPRAAREVAQVLAADVKRRFASGTTPGGQRWRSLKYPRPRGGDRPGLDTGRLMNSVTAKVEGDVVVVGTAHPAAPLFNFGGLVRPKKAKRLAIPLTPEAVRAGSPRRMRGGLKVPLFARKVRGKWVGHWLLVRQVRVPAREFLGVSREGWAAVAAVLGDAAARRWAEGRSPGV